MTEEEYNHYFARISQLCALKEKCEQDVQKKLMQWKIPEEEIEKLLDSLKQLDFINHQRYASAFARDKLRFNHWGRKKIAYALHAKNIEEKYIQEAMEALPDQQYENILENELDKKLKKLKVDDQNQLRNKLCQYLIQKGFESGKVFEFVNEKIREMNNAGKGEHK
ncbi:MAG TPA: regulatory protein RecX [Bacteroidales bacterium]|nr:regulatory protein RecX [Bacteroidales bacterium]